MRLQPVLTGLGLGALLLLVVVILVPREHRRQIRGAFVLLLVYAGSRAAMSLIVGDQFPSKLLHFVAVFAWCASMMRALFTLFTTTRFGRLFGKPWPKILRDVVQAVLYFIVALVALRAIGVEPGQLLTTSAVLTAVLGFSMQDTLGNLFAGLALQGQQTITVGDWVRFEEGSDGFGEVTEINWRATHFLTLARVHVVVPNGVLARAVVRNYSRPTPLVRSRTEIALPYDVSPERVRQVMLASIRGVEGVAAQPEPSVLIQDFSDVGVVYNFRYFIADPGRKDPIDGAVRQRLYYALARARIDIPFPRREIGLHYPAGVAPDRAGTTDPPAAAGPIIALERLTRFDIFKSLSPSDLLTVAEASHSALYSPGEAIARQGDTGSDLFALERGRVEVTIAPEGRPPVRITTLEAGSLFGEAALLTGERRTATVTALTECEVIVISRAPFKPIIDRTPALLERLTARLAERMDQLNQAIATATDGDTDQGRRSEYLVERIRKFFTG